MKLTKKDRRRIIDHLATQVREIYMHTFHRDKLEACMEAAYDLGRAAQAEKVAKEWDGQYLADAKRLRAKVRKMLEGR